MNNPVEIFIEYLLDTETTSEISFNDDLLKKDIMCHKEYLSDFEQLIDNKLKQWKNSDQNDKRIIADSLTTDDALKVSDSESELELDREVTKETSSENENEEQLDIETEHEQSDVYDDIDYQCQRLLQFMYYCQQQHVHFRDLYFHTLKQCIESNNDKILIVALEQIASHLSEITDNDNEYQCLIECLPSDVFKSPKSEQYQSILSTIQALISTNQVLTSLDNLDVLYPYRAHFLDARREFRDSTHYFIDGDSLILSIAHHKNVNLNSYYGNTLHVIFIIERILLTLFNQSHQCNFTLVFFDSHHQLYQESSILSLIRASLIAHLDKNSDKYGKNKVQQFSSWLDDDYLKFIREEKPIFMFYHDISSFDIETDNFLSKNTLQKLVRIYHLFGNYHQYVHECHLYLMNKLNLTDISVQCFQIQFKQKCPIKSLTEMVKIVFSDSSIMNIKRQDGNEFEKFCYEIGQNDVRLLLYLKTIAEFIPEEKEKDLFNLLSPVFVLHVALLIRLSLADRHLSLGFPSITFSPIFSELIVQFQNRLASNLTTTYPSSLSWTKIADLFDGRLFAFTIYHIHQSSSNIRLDSITLDIVKQSLIVLNRQPSENIFGDAIKQMIETKDIIFPSSSTEEQHTIVNVERQKIARISNAFIDTYLQPILPSNNELSFDLVDPDDSLTVRYEGRHHWHTYQEVGSEIDRIRNDDEEKQKFYNHRFRTRTDQKFYEYSALYGESLTSPDIKDNQLQIILPSTSIPTTMNEKGTQATSNNGKKPKHEDQPNKEVQPGRVGIIEARELEKLKKRIKEETEQMENFERLLKSIPIDDYAKAIDFIDQYLSNFKIPDNRLKLFKQKFRLQRKYLQSLRKKRELTPDEKSNLHLLQIGFFATMTEMVPMEKIVDVFDKKKKYMEELVDHSPFDREIWYRFQLEKINSRIPRREQGVPDKRISDFIPDEWQVNFLNAVDKRESIIIVAPTASGKTYASYYAMNKVLKDPDDSRGICVYIAPTKALVNQVAATIHSKIGAVFGIFTRDYRRNMDNCRILVTVPQCLEILLLSPSHQRWCQRIKYAIFDEIHCMSGEGGSDVWEKIMLLINCPMIGLSATVNNGKELCQWIENVENQRSVLFETCEPRQVRFIVHHERMADLNKYLYTNRQLHPIHPVGVMNAKQLITRGVPQDFSLSPCETLQLHDAMKEVLIDISVPTLTEFFSPDWVIERNRCNDYSRLVRNQFNELIETKNNCNIDTIAASLRPITSNDIQYPESKAISQSIIEFVLTLREKNLLPCIVFTDNRKLCETMAVSVANYFEEHERRLRETKYKKEIEEIQKRMEQINNPRFQAKIKKLIKSSTKRGTNRDDNYNPADTQTMLEDIHEQTKLSGYEFNLLYGVLEEAKLMNRHGYDEKLVKKFLDRSSSFHSKLARCMSRGVAYHHAGLISRDRVAVEALYRNRYIQIIFSTSTLSLGIHMPTKTVGFVQDSIYLDALQYRQSSGRAGRRGFDIQGHVVFIDIPLAKIRHLIISAIPNIHAHFPTSITFLMRLLQLCSNAKDSNDAKNRALVALQCPFILQSDLKYHLVNTQLRFHALHTFDFLHRLNLINKRGDLVGLAGLATHLHYFEPANILLVFLMATELFHALTDEEEIVAILARLFSKELRLITRQKYENLLEHRKKSKLNSRLFLPPISEQFRQRVEVYNTLVKNVYGCYIENVTRYLRPIYVEQIEMLPFSNISFAQQSSDYDDGSFEYQLHHQSEQTRNPSISPFAGLSGLTHQGLMSNYSPINGSWDLVYDLDLSSKIVPFVDVDCRDHTNTAYHLDSYALDFYKHGSEKSLINENGLNPGNTHDLLLDFRFVLASIATSLEVIVKNEENQTTLDYREFFLPLYNSISNIENTFSKKFYRQYPSFKA